MPGSPQVEASNRGSSKEMRNRHHTEMTEGKEAKKHQPASLGRLSEPVHQDNCYYESHN